MRLVGFLGQRLFYLALQLLGVVTITFFLVHLLPGNPAEALAGVGASPATVATISHRLGLDKPLPEQYVIYLNNVIHGQLGDAIYTGQTVVQDLAQRIPATLELVTVSMVIAVVIGIPLGIYSGLRRRGIVSKVVFVYGMLTGAIPDFWLALILIFVLFYVLRWAPPPLGRIGILTPPPHVTGFYLIDSVLNGDPGTFTSVVKYMALPVATLVFVYMGNIVKQARASIEEVEQSDFIEYARACGLSERVVLRYMLRNALAPVVTVIAITYGFLFGGAVLVETVFSWGGLGQYAVQSITNSDYAPVTGFVLVAALFMAVIYLVVDLLYVALDPRIQY
jgi:ABC-type dipeptide/oligopeptide/nickel transport system permease component